MTARKYEAEMFSQRLRRIMQDANYKISATALAHEFNLRHHGEGITVAAANNWLNGVSVPKMDKLKTLAALLQVQPQDFLFDRPLRQSLICKTDELLGVVHVENVSALDISALRCYRQLSSEHQRMVREVVNSFSMMTRNTQITDLIEGAPGLTSP